MNLDKIKSIRGSLGYTQDKLAMALGTTKTTVGRWEIGQAKPAGNALSRLTILEVAISKDKDLLTELAPQPAALSGALELCVAAIGNGERFVTSGATMTQVLSGAAGATLYNSLSEIQKN